MSIELSIAEARRMALAAQGFGARAPAGLTGVGHLHRAVERLGVVQIDSVNVLVRSHYLPLFSRFGSYPTSLLDRAAYQGRRRVLFEYWGHEASLLPVGCYPLLRWRMERAARGKGLWSGVARFGRERRAFIEDVLAQVRDRGPLGASELREAGRRTTKWWGWSDGKAALEWLFWSGAVTTATRRQFERVYDLTERVLPARVLNAPVPAEADAQRALLLIAARALGVATERDLRDYFRLPVADAKAGIAELVQEGSLVPARVEQWKQAAYVHRAARVPRIMDACALLSPFDSLVWERQRTERLFDFHYRLEIYTPSHKRVHGYYVLPFLLGDRLVARVDLKADRPAGTLRVLGVHAEHYADPDKLAGSLGGELRRMAGWLGLERVTAPGKGRLQSSVRKALRS